MTIDKYPPNLGEGDNVILFDGVCKLCNGWSNFIIKYDNQHQFTLCSVQSPEGQQILQYFNMPIDHFDTMLYVEGNRYFEKSDAFLKIVYKLGFPWRILYVFNVIPRSIRNWLYDRIALNRYTLFGKFDSCMLPTKENENRFLKSKT